MGVPMPLGYDIIDRQLIIDESKAATLRLISERYDVLGSEAGDLDSAKS